MVCIVITRNGTGDAWAFANMAAARQHAIPQMDDVFANDPQALTDQYGRGHIDELLKFVEGRDRARLVDGIETWRGLRPGSVLMPELRQLVWSKVVAAAKKPPSDPADIIQIIVADREYREGRTLRSLPGEDAVSAKLAAESASTRRTTMSEASPRAPKIPDNAVITITTEEGKNPKRVDTPSYARFALYKDGMTVAKAKEKGVRAADISYDMAKGFISVDNSESAE